MDRRAFLVSIPLLAGCSRFVDDESGITEPGDVEIGWSTLVRDDPGTEDERVTVWGLVRNVGDRTLRYIEIRATFLDEDGEELETVIEHVQDDVGTGTEWEFTIEFPDFGERAARVSAYDLEPVTGV